jgi:hypothetical protein
MDLFPQSGHDAGGRVRLVSRAQGQAVFGGPDDCYRYRLSRLWAPPSEASLALFVMMNPSTADASLDDPTVAKCVRMVKAWGYDGIMVGNTFAYRATDQGRLVDVADPIGPDNDMHLVQMAQAAAVTVFAYGKPKHRALRARGPAVARLLMANGVQPHVLRLSSDGCPWHPLYLPDATKPTPWVPT